MPISFREAHLEGVPDVIRVLDHLCGGHVGADHGGVELRIERRQQLAGALIRFADHRFRRVVVVENRRAFAQEFRVVADAEIHARRLAGTTLERRDHRMTHGSRQHGAAHDDDVKGVFRRERAADFLAHAADVSEIEAAVRLAGRTHADDGKLRTGDRLPGVCRGAEQVILHGFADDAVDVLFNDRRTPIVDEPHLGFVRIHTDDAMPVAGKTPRRHAAYVAKTEDADQHQSPRFLIVECCFARSPTRANEGCHAGISAIKAESPPGGCSTFVKYYYFSKLRSISEP